jgi:hypothetical protein
MGSAWPFSTFVNEIHRLAIGACDWIGSVPAEQEILARSGFFPRSLGRVFFGRVIFFSFFEGIFGRVSRTASCRRAEPKLYP